MGADHNERGSEKMMRTVMVMRDDDTAWEAGGRKRGRVVCGVGEGRASDTGQGLGCPNSVKRSGRVKVGVAENKQTS